MTSEEFNKLYPVGSRLRFQGPDGELIEGKTRSIAFNVSTADKPVYVVKFENFAKAIPLSLVDL